LTIFEQELQHMHPESNYKVMYRLLNSQNSFRFKLLAHTEFKSPSRAIQVK